MARNPAAMTNPPRPQWSKATVWDIEQVRLFLGEAKRSSRYHALYLMAIMTGMRLGELLGLRWQDVDLLAKRVTIRQTFYRPSAWEQMLYAPPVAFGNQPFQKGEHLPSLVQ